jgi:hypothetical protein
MWRRCAACVAILFAPQHIKYPDAEPRMRSLSFLVKLRTAEAHGRGYFFHALSAGPRRSVFPFDKVTAGNL